MRTHATLLVAMFLIFHALSVAAGMDDARLKEWLKGGLFELLLWQDYDIKASGVTDEQFHRVLMDLYREAEDKWPTLTPNTDEWNYNQKVVEGVLGCLPMCGDRADKTFLLDYADSKEKDSVTRAIAVSSYLRIANAEEARDALIRFLVGKERMGSLERLSIYNYAKVSFEVSASAEKRAAILAALVSAANREEGKIEFMKADRILAERSAAYLRSRERLAMLERHSLEPPTANVHTDRDLKAALEEARQFQARTSVSTNLTALMARDFNQPLSDDGWAALIIPPSAEPASGAVREDKLRPTRRTRRIALGVTALVALAAVGVWVFIRQQKASRP